MSDASRPAFDRRTDRVVVCGPPCSGKTTFAREHALVGDEVLDWDELYAEISGAPLFERPYGFSGMVEAEFQRRAAALERGFILRSAPRHEQRGYLREFYGAQSVVLLVPARICLARLGRSRAPCVDEGAAARLHPPVARRVHAELVAGRDGPGPARRRRVADRGRHGRAGGAV